MNILNDKSDISLLEKSQIEQVQQQKQEFKLLGTYLRTAGLNLYCYNPKLNKVEEVEVVNNCKTCVLIHLVDGLVVEPYNKPKINIDPTWDYFEALNLKNAISRVNKFKLGKIKSIWNLRLPNDPKKMQL